MIWLLLTLLQAYSAEVRVVSPHGEPTPGRPGLVHVAAVDDAGTPLEDARVSVDLGVVRRLDAVDVVDGVTAWVWTPPVGAARGVFSINVAGRTYEAPLDIAPRATLDWGLPARVDAQAGTQLLLRIAAADRPNADDLVVHTSEPAEVELRETADALEVRLRPSGQGARVLTVGLHDRTHPQTPQVVRVRLFDRQRRTFDLEPGASLRIRLGSRVYGPFVASDSGSVAATLDQWPGEVQAELIVRDDLGNELVTPYVLGARSAPDLLLIGTGPLRPGRLPPEVIAVASTPDGRPWRGAAPKCQVPGTEQATVTPLERGRFAVGVPAAGADQGVRVGCSLGQARADLRLTPEAGLPAAVDLKVWPEQISLDFPVAEVTVHLLDGTGERVAADRVTVQAEKGAVKLEDTDGASRRGEYRGGADAIASGDDRVVAAWNAPPGDGGIAGVQVAHGVIPRVGSVRVSGRALDASGRPLPEVPISLSIGPKAATVTSGPDGWATVELASPADLAPVVVEARSAGWVHRRLAPRGAPPTGHGPGRPDLVDEANLSLTTGRVSVVDVSPDTPVLYLLPNAQLDVRVQLTDRAGQPVLQEVPVVSADIGNISALRPHPDGGYLATYTPPGDRRARTVTIVARSRSGPASGSARIRLEYPPLNAAIGAGVGAMSNLGALRSPLFSLHGDLRLPVNPFFGRVGIGGYAVSKTVETAEFGEVDKRLTVLPVTLAGLARQDRGRNAGWVGLGVVLAPYYATEVFDGTRLPPRQGVLTPGLTGIVGGGRRIGPGELMLEFRGLLLVGSSGSGFTGQVGGLMGVLGYRFVID